MMPSKSQMITIGLTFALLWAVNNVGALSPAKDFLNN